MLQDKIYQEARKKMLTSCGLLSPWNMVFAMANHDMSENLKTKHYRTGYNKPIGKVEDLIFENEVNSPFKAIQVNRTIKNTTPKGVVSYKCFVVYDYMDTFFKWRCSSIHLDFSLMPEKERPYGCKTMLFFKNSNTEKECYSFQKDDEITERLQIPQEIEEYLCKRPISEMIVRELLPRVFKRKDHIL